MKLPSVVMHYIRGRNTLNPNNPFLSVFIYMCVFIIFVIMSYSDSLENVLEQIETAESNLNKNLIGIFKISNLKRYKCKISEKLYQSYVMFADFLQSRK